MSLTEQGTITSANQVVESLKNFVAANGWVVDFYGLYNAYNRLHCSKAGAHFEIYATAASVVTNLGCTGYTSGAIPTAQPGASATAPMTFTAGALYCLVSSGNSIYLGATATTASGSWLWGGFGQIGEKVGVWPGGQWVAAGAAGAVLFNATTYTSHKCKLLRNGVWSGISLVEGAVKGSASDLSLLSAQPNHYNGAIVPVPILLSVANATTSLFHPIGYAPGIYACKGGNIYMCGDIIPIGGVDHLLMPMATATIAAGEAYLFRLSA